MQRKNDIELLEIIKKNTNLSSNNIAVIAGYTPSAKINSRINKIAISNNIDLPNNRTGKQTCKNCHLKYNKNNAKYGAWLCCSKNCYNEELKNGLQLPTLTTGKIKRINKIKQQTCIICNHSIIIEVHHINCQRHDNRETNLVALCANHHKMVHLSKYHNQIQNRIDRYMIDKYGELYDYIDSNNFYCFDKQTNSIKKRPNKEILIAELNNSSISELSRKYNVNIATIYKWKYYHKLT